MAFQFFIYCITVKNIKKNDNESIFIIKFKESYYSLLQNYCLWLLIVKYNILAFTLKQMLNVHIKKWWFLLYFTTGLTTDANIVTSSIWIDLLIYELYLNKYWYK